MKHCYFILGVCLALCSFAVNAQEGLSLKQRILMPGPVIEGHADIEAQCEKCHVNFEKQALTKLCMDCHEDVAADRNSKEGYHGQHPLASVNDCETCHTDHEGRDADIIGLQPESFDHNFTRFALEGKHVTQACESCHEEGDKFREASTQCFDCHKEDDVHKGALGEDCGSCHTPQAWPKLSTFDHDDTDFPLKGKHVDVSCTSCHIDQQYEFEVHTCFSCHKADDVHGGANGQECQDCHTEEGWEKQSFDHDETDFPLRGMHDKIPCHACHANEFDRDKTPQDCHSCHASADIHLGRNGKKCEDCHNTVKWSESIFDHDKDTAYPLTGKHTEVSCTQCHIGSVDDPVALDCAGCHAADDIHKDPDMELCGTCHSTEGWLTINRFDHDLTAMPLVGMHQIVPCISCHIGNQFSSIDQNCVSCHGPDDVHKGSLGQQCNQCHTPNAWNIWVFDHELQTGYKLEGKHEKLSCDSCHVPGSKPEDTSSICGECHRAQDIHNGEFGVHCDRCHGTETFKELYFEQGGTDVQILPQR